MQQLVLLGPQQLGFRGMPAATTAEAMAALEERHGDKIAMGRLLAIQLCVANGKVISREVVLAMRERGLVPPGDRCHWIAMVFRHPMFVWSGARHSYSDPARNLHERTVKVWKLRGSGTGGL